MIDFNHLIDNFFARKTRKKTIGTYYPSEIGGCIRKTWFSYKIPKPVDKDIMKIFGAGNTVHDLITEVLKSEKNPGIKLLETELPFKQFEKDFVISGRIDNLVLIMLDNKKVLIEVKSTKFLPNEPKDAHVSQLQLYMHNTKIHDGTILYVQKDNLQTRWFNQTYDEQKAKEIIDKFYKLHKSLKENNIPHAEAKLTNNKNWMCDYCEYREECDKYPLE